MGWFHSDAPNPEDSYNQIYQGGGDPYQPHEGKLSHEALGGAAAFMAMRMYEQRQAAQGKPPSHQFAKEMLAGIVGGEVDKLIETKGLDYMDAEKAKAHARREAEHMYDQRFGQEDLGGGGGMGGGMQGGGMMGGGMMGGGMQGGGYDQQQGGYGGQGGGYGGQGGMMQQGGFQGGEPYGDRRQEFGGGGMGGGMQSGGMQGGGYDQGGYGGQQGMMGGGGYGQQGMMGGGGGYGGGERREERRERREEGY